MTIAVVVVACIYKLWVSSSELNIPILPFDMLLTITFFVKANHVPGFLNPETKKDHYLRSFEI